MTSLDKAFTILDIFLRIVDYEIRLSELAKLSGLHIATVSRIVTKLVDHGYLSQAEKRGKYMLGTKFLEFSAIIEQTNMIRRIAMPYMIELYKSIDETVAIFKWDGTKIIFIDEIRIKDFPQLMGGSHAPFPVYCTAIGKAVLSGMSYHELDSFLNNTEIKAYTLNTITDIDEIKEHLGKVAREGIAYEDEEYQMGIRGLAASIRGSDGRTVGCVGVLGPITRLSLEKMEKIAPHLKECTRKISLKLGFRENPVS